MARRIAIALIVLAMGIFPAGVIRAQISPGELSAPHASLEGLRNCTSCHELGKLPDGERCLACHVELTKGIAGGKGYHANLKSQQCVQCHKEHHGRDFALIRWGASFDHRAAGFDLVGKHGKVACRACHVAAHIKDPGFAGSQTAPAARTYLGLSRDCSSCHADPHAGRLGVECTKCHGSEAWKPATGFSHDQTRFPLSGKHQVVRCELCHGGTALVKTVRYAGLAFRACVDCHKDPHAGRFKQACEGCHTTGGWESAGKKFDHARTRFPLRGKHVSVACARCHASEAGQSPARARFVVARFSRCTDCHADPHGRQFASRKDRGECTVCHTEQAWKPALIPGFNHGTTRFPLRGKHEAAACALCHVVQANSPAGIRKIDVKAASRCADCHQDVHRGQFALRSDGGACESCHRETGFRPSTYVMPAHAGARFVLDGAHEAVPCDRCHKLDIVKGEKMRAFRWERVPVCETCHKDVHGGLFADAKGGGCVSCHVTQAWKSTVYDHSRTGFRIDGKHRSVSCAACHSQGTAKQAAWRFRGTPTKCAGCHATIREGTTREVRS